jgi:hypothetical protein
LYLRCVDRPQGVGYVLRESVLKDGFWVSRDLMDLGEDPTQYIVYPGGTGYYFDPCVESILDEKGVVYEAAELEEVFLPFLRSDIRRVVEMFAQRKVARSIENTLVLDKELKEQHLRLHDFDKRRLHFLRFGRIDSGNLNARPWKFLKVLLRRSRDEIEHMIQGMEAGLRPHEIKTYVYSAFHLEAYFQNHLLKHHPIGLDPDRLDACFLDEVCQLNRDRNFFHGISDHDPNRLHLYLRRYVVPYFDFDFGGQRLDPSFYREFIHRSRAYGRAGMATASLPMDEALGIFGLSKDQLDSMNQDDLAKHYRKTAKKAHPDGGGGHEDFIKITEAYETLRRKIG